MNKRVKIYLTDQILCSPDWNWVSASSGWRGYHIWCVEDGHADVKIGKEVHTLYKGDIFLFDLNYNHICTHDRLKPLTVSTIYFDVINLNYQTLFIRQNLFFIEIVHKILSEMERHNSTSAEIWLEALLTEFERKTDIPIIHSHVVRRACELMDEKIFEALTLNEIAEYTGYSKNQLIRLFRKEIGCTPMQYFNQKKINYAKGQLIYSNRSQKEISDMLGFSDCCYFGKVFKKQVGCSPGHYRGNAKLQSKL